MKPSEGQGAIRWGTQNTEDWSFLKVNVKTMNARSRENEQIYTSGSMEDLIHAENITM